MTVAYDPGHFTPPAFHTARPAFDAGSDTPRAFLERCLDVIARREEVVNAWVVINDGGARAQADASSARWRQGRPLSPIDGMPIGVKDLLETRDMPTQMGCKAYTGHYPKNDNAAVWALREAGAIILGKTVTTELGGAFPGPTTNPFDRDHTPGGSSSGSAAAVGAGMLPVCIGTQVGGSICRPASFCANFALKPSQGAINRGERQATTMSTHGPHAGSIEDMWAVAIEIAKRAGGDPGFAPLRGPATLPEARRPLTLIVMEGEGWARLDAASLFAFEQVLRQLVDAGVHVLRRTHSLALERFERSLEGVTALNIGLTAWENHWTLRNILARQPDGVSEQGQRTMAVAKALGLDGYQDGLRQRAIIKGNFTALAGLADAVIAPASVGPAPRWSADHPDPTIAIPTGDPAFNTPGSILGACVVTMPITSVRGLPMGVQLMGQSGEDAHVTAMARWICETVTPVVA